MLLRSREWVTLCTLILIALYGSFPSILVYCDASIPPILLAEDGVYETLGVIACIIATVIFFNVARRAPSPRAWFFLLAIATLFLALEELSWGQRLFGIALPPEVESGNFQGELNLHNSKLLQSRNGIINSYLRMGYMLYFVVLPILLLLFSSLNQLIHWMKLPVPSTFVAISTLVAVQANSINFATWVGNDLSPIGSRLPEAYESNLQLIMLVFAVESWVYRERVGGELRQ